MASANMVIVERNGYRYRVRKTQLEQYRKQFPNSSVVNDSEPEPEPKVKAEPKAKKAEKE